MSNRLPFIAVIAAVILFLVYSSIFVVNAGQQAIVLRFGEIVDVKTEPGIYFKAPFAVLRGGQRPAHRKAHPALRPRQHPRAGLGRQILRGRRLRRLPHLGRQDVPPGGFGQHRARRRQRLRTRLDAALRRVYGVRGFESALSEERASMMREVRDQLRPDATSLGLEIEDVRIRRTDLTEEVSQQTYDRMKAERLAEAERLRARGREAAQRIRARADREVVEIVAEARKESEILRGEGEAQRNGDLRRGLPARSGLLRVLPLDDRLLQRAASAPGRPWCCRPIRSSSATSAARTAEPRRQGRRHRPPPRRPGRRRGRYRSRRPRKRLAPIRRARAESGIRLEHRTEKCGAVFG